MACTVASRSMGSRVGSGLPSRPKRAVGRPISVPASQAVMTPWRRESNAKRIARRSAIDRADWMRPASRRMCLCRAMAGRLKPNSRARLEGRRGWSASAAMIRRRVGSASSSIPAPFRRGMAVPRSSAVAAIMPATASFTVSRRPPGRDAAIPTSDGHNRTRARLFRLVGTTRESPKRALVPVKPQDGVQQGVGHRSRIVPLGRNYPRIAAERPPGPRDRSDLARPLAGRGSVARSPGAGSGWSLRRSRSAWHRGRTARPGIRSRSRTRRGPGLPHWSHGS